MEVIRNSNEFTEGFVLHNHEKNERQRGVMATGRLNISGESDATLRQHLLFSNPSPNTGGSLVSVYLIGVQRETLLPVQTHSSYRVRG